MITQAVKDKNKNLWFKVSLRLARIYLETGDMVKLDELLRVLKKCCERDDDDQIMESGGKGSAADMYNPQMSNLLLETFSIEIQMCQVTKDKKRMNRVYPLTTQLNAVISDPKVMGVIKECGGKMFMDDKKWDLALEELNDAFKFYNESGN